MSVDIYHYEGLRCWGPMSDARLEQLLDFVSLRAGDRALDLGCGRGELSLRAIERFGVHATAVDRSEGALALLEQAAESRGLTDSLTVRRCDVAAFEPEQPAHLVSWLGGPYLGGAFASTLEQLARWVAPEGQLLVGHGFWAEPPPDDYLRATGLAADEFGAHHETLALGRSLGLRPHVSFVASRDEWDVFEGTILSNVERYALSHPEAPDPQGRLEQRRVWNDAQQRWGRSAMGFGLYLFGR